MLMMPNGVNVWWPILIRCLVLVHGCSMLCLSGSATRQMVTSSGIRRPVSPSERLLREALALFLRRWLLQSTERSVLGFGSHLWGTGRVSAWEGAVAGQFVCTFRPGPVCKENLIEPSSDF